MEQRNVIMKRKDFKKEFLALTLLLSLPACWGPFKRKGAKKPSNVKRELAFSEVDMPLAEQEEELVASLDDEESVRSFVFEDEMDNFVLKDDEDLFESAAEVEQVAQIEEQDERLTQELSWAQEKENQADSFEKVYFKFNRHSIEKDQEKALAHDVALAKQKIAEQEAFGITPELTLVVEGHSCHSAGSAAYNLALSEKRAKALADRMVESGIPREYIKIVGRGQEVPVIDEATGKVVTGDRQEQWANRRDEVRVINA